MVTFDEAYNASLEYFEGDTIAAQKFVSKYALHDPEGNFLELTPDDMHRRLAKEFARIESKYPNPMSEDLIFDLLKDFRYIVPQGSPMSGIGNPFQLQSLSNCFVVQSPYDSYGGILKTDQELVQIMKRRGGVGFDLSTIRPKGFATSNAAKTTDGIEVFMERWSNSCREVAQGGRRGALMMTISCHHPQIRDFIKIKRDLTKVTGANISIRLTDEFMEAVKNKEQVQLRFPVEKDAQHLVSEMVDANMIWDEIIESAHNFAEPGLLFWDTVKRMGPSDVYADKGFDTVSTNPCLAGDTQVAVADGRGMISIKQLADEGRDVPVYACDNNGKIVVKTMRNPRVTGFKKPVYKVTIEGGYTFKATKNHKMRMIDGSYHEVGDLVEGDQLYIARRRHGSLVELTQNGLKDDKKKYFLLENAKGKKSEHRLIWESVNGQVPAGHVIHHIDFNSFNNSIDNLMCMDAGAHTRLHADRILGDKNPMCRAKTEWTSEKWDQYRNNMSVAVSGLKNGRAFINVTDDDFRQHALKLTKQLGRRFSATEWHTYCVENNLPVGSKFREKTVGSTFTLGTWAATQLGFENVDLDTRTQQTMLNALSQGYEVHYTNNNVEVKRECEECHTHFWQAFVRREVAFCSTRCSNLYVNRTTDTNLKRMQTINEAYEKKSKETKKNILDSYTELRFKLGRLPLQYEVMQLCKEKGIPHRLNTKHGFKNWNEIKDAALIHNHRVISVEYAGDEDVYNGTVDDVHSFHFGNDQILLESKNCGEITLCADDSCRLILINLTSFVVNKFTDKAFFDVKTFSYVVQKAQRLMDDLVDLEVECIDKIIEKIKTDPEPDNIKQTEIELWQRIKNKGLQGRRTGLGVTGFGDALAMLGIVYGSKKEIDGQNPCLTMTELMYKTLAVETYRSSAILAKERGAFPIFDYEREKNHPFVQMMIDSDEEVAQLIKLYGRRNIACNTTAPAGSVSLMTQTTSGIEPAFLLNYTRRSKISGNDKNATVSFVDKLGDKWQEFEVFHHGFKEWMDVTGNTLLDIEKSPYFKATSNDTDWEMKIKMQSVAQKWLDHSISSTTNIPEHTSIDVTKKIYMTGWESGCKGVTIYRANSRMGVLVDKTTEEKNEFEQHSAPKRPKELKCKIHHANIKNETWTLLIGMLDEMPYEIFGGLSRYVVIPKKYDEGFLIKNVKKASISTYDLKLGDDDFLIKNVVEQFDNPNYSVMTRMISLALRHGAPIQYVVEQLQKGDRDSDMFSFAKVISRVLKSYIVDGASTTLIKKCESCGGSSFAYQENCPKCLDCGWTRC